MIKPSGIYSVLAGGCGHPVETFASAAEFLSTERRDLACLILDHHMPQMTGLQLAEKLHADGSTIPILLITGSPSPAIVARAAQLDIRVLEKPPDEDERSRFHRRSTALTVGRATARQWSQPPSC